MSDKTALGISKELRQYIEALVEEVVLEGKPFENQKKYLQRFSEAEGINYTTLETNLSALFETAEELQAHESKGNERFLQLLAKECYISHDVINKIVSDINTKRRKLEEEEAKRRAEEDARWKREAEERAKAVRKAKDCCLSENIVNELMNMRTVIYEEPKIPYLETITKVSRADYRHKKLSGRAGQFGEVHLIVEPYTEDMPDPVVYKFGGA